MFPKTKNSILKLIVSIAICEGVGIAGSFFTTPAIPTWYRTLEKPAFSPPSWVFAPVWTTLFLLMGISLYLIWDSKKSQHKQKMEIIAVFCIQLVLNLYWSILFFGLKNVGAAFINIIILWISILATIIVFSLISKKAAYLLIPYLLWVSFASYLNWGHWQLIKHPRQVTVCTTEAKLCPDGSTVGRTGLNCSFTECPQRAMKSPIIPVKQKQDLPIGYSLEKYTIAVELETSCTQASECETPAEYLMRSSCPYTSLCLNNKCTVVCPNHE